MNNKQIKNKLLFLITLTSCLAFSCSVSASETVGTIQSNFKMTRVCHDASCSTYGTLNFLPTGLTTPLTITDSGFSGYIWGDELGWINFTPSSTSTVTINPVSGDISGMAWTQQGGWLNFRPTGSMPTGNVPIGVSINSYGEFHGYAWMSGPFGGWVKFDCSSVNTCVKTDYKLVTYRTANYQVLGASSFGGGGSSNYSQVASSPSQITAPQTTSVVESPSTPSSLIVSPNTSSVQLVPLARPVLFGTESNDIKVLQAVLASDKEIYPEGIVTGFFGPLTEKAIQKFQVKYNLATPDDEAYGYVGPATRAKLNSLMGN